MQSIELLRKEHEEIEQYLLDFEELIESGAGNIPALNHFWRKFCDYWNNHEIKEERIFSMLSKTGVDIPVKKIIFDHGELKKQRTAIVKAISMGNEANILNTLEKHGRMLIQMLREHINLEDEILYSLPEEQMSEADIQKVEEVMIGLK